MNFLQGKDIKRIFGAIRQIVPENIDLEPEKEYTYDVTGNVIVIYDESTLVYHCRFTTENKELSLQNILENSYE